jgi:hypothetical protein
MKSIKSKKNTIIIAPEKTGKSSFLLHISKKLEQKYSPVLFSAEHCITLESYIKSNLLRLLTAHNDIFGSSPKEFLSLSILDMDKRISALKLSDAAKQSLKLLLLFDKDKSINMQQVIESLFALPSMLASESKRTSVIFIDDAESIASFKSDDASLATLFDLIKSGKLSNSIFILASSHRLSLDSFEELPLLPMNIESTREFLKLNSLALDESALTTLFNMTGGIPFYLNYFARIISKSNVKDSFSITAILSDSLANELNSYYSERIKQLSPKELPILFCMAEHKVNTPSRISKLLNYSQTNVRRFLSIMEEKGFVTLKDRGVFEIDDPVFRRWLEVRSG